MAEPAAPVAVAGPVASPAPDRPAPTRRGTELFMLSFAAVLVTGALMLVEVNQEEQLSWRLLWYGLAYLAVFAVAHLAVRAWAPYGDPLILPCVALLNGIGLVMIYRLDLAYAERAV